MKNKKDLILEVFSDFDFSCLSKDELDHISIDNDLIKGFNSNKNKYNLLKKQIKPFKELVFFDICHLLGFYAKNGRELDNTISVIAYLYVNYDERIIENFIKQLHEIHYNEKYANLLAQLILNNKLALYPSFYAEFYNNFKTFNAHIIKINNNRIRNLNIKSDYSYQDALLIDQIKKTGKNITVEDTIDYIAKIILLNENPELEKIKEILLLETFDYNELKEIIDFYHYACHKKINDEQYFENITLFSRNFTIKWLPSTDPLNLILGYLLKICCTFTGNGSKIMIDSILDERNKNIVVRNIHNQIVGKATCVYNDTHLFCNGISFDASFLNTLSSKEELNIYHYYLLGINHQYQSLLKKGYQIDEIRIAKDEEFIINCLKKHNNCELKKLLQILSFGWGEDSEKLFDHEKPDYIKNKHL